MIDEDLYIGDYPKAIKIISAAPSRQYPQGRTCRDCGTSLSIYNPKPTCYAHTESRPVLPRGKHLKVEGKEGENGRSAGSAQG